MTALGTLTGASPLNANDASRLLFTTNTTETLSRALDDTPANFGNMNTLSWQVDYRQSGRADDTLSLGIRIVNGATILAAADSGGTFATVSSNVTSTTDVLSSVTAFAYVNTSANKTTWDGATIELQQTYSQNMGPDGARIEVDYVAITGDYTIGATNTNVPLNAGSFTLAGFSARANVTEPLAAGSYSLTGANPSVTKTKFVTADAGSFTLTGFSGNTFYYMEPSPGSFTLTGFDATASTASDTNVPLDAGSYSLTGYTANLIVNDAIGLDAGSFSLSGLGAGVTPTLPMGQGNYTLTGFDATVSTAANTTVTLDAGGYTLTGLDAGLPVSLAMGAGGYTLTGQTANLIVNDAIGLDAGAFAMTGLNASVSVPTGTSVPLDAGSFTLTGFSGNTFWYLPPATGSFSLSGFDATASVSGDTLVALDAGAFALTGYAYTFEPQIVGGTGTFLVFGGDISFETFPEIFPEAGSFTLTGLDLTVAVDDQIALDGGSFTLTGFDAAAIAGQNIPLDAGSFALTGLTANVVGSNVEGLDAGSYTLTGFDASAAAGANVLADAGSYTLTGFAATVVGSDVIGLDAGSYAITGFDATAQTTSTNVTLNAGAYTLTGLDATAGQSAFGVSMDAGSYVLTGWDVVYRTPTAPTSGDVCREPVQIVEIVQPLCALTYGTAPCTASGTADEKCYNTRATCQDTANYDGSSTLSLFFSRGNVAEQRITGAPYIIPSLKSVSTAPTRINLAGANPDAQGIGNRAVCNIEFIDHPHTDRRVDPYVSGRSWNPMDRGSFWSKWLVRNKYRQNIRVNVYEGYAGQALADMTKRSYFLQSATGPDSQGRVSIQGKDILARIEERKAQAPTASPGELYADITAVATSFEVANAVEADYPATGTIRVGDELMTYTGRSTSTNGITFTGVARGTDGTTAATHTAEDAVQECVRYTNARPDDVLEDLLTTYGGVPSAFLDTANWATEVNDYLSFYRLNTVISEPTSVTELVNQVQENVMCYIWWDERVALVKFKAIRGIDAEPPVITAESNIIEGSFSLAEKPRERASRAWVFYRHKNYVDPTDDADSYASQSVFANLESETDDLYGEASIRRVYAPWLTSGALADTTASKILTRFVDVPTAAQMRMDAKDRDYWVGDTVTISHFLDVDEFGERRLRNWTIISAEEVTPGEVVEYTLEDTTLYGRIHYVMAGGTADYPGAASVPFKNCYIGNAAGLLSDGTTAGRIN